MATIETYARPTWLYRYRSLGAERADGISRASLAKLERELNAIERGYIYCSTFNQMNDPMEGFYRSSGRVRSHPQFDKFSERVRNEKLNLGIASLSETWNNELMWAHYAGGFSGLCVGYSVSSLLAGLNDQHALARVAYGDKPYLLNLSGVRNEDARARAILTTKNLKWSYEREWRLFAAMPGLAEHGHGAVTSVFLGMRRAEADRKIIRRRLRAAGIRVSQTLVDGYSVKQRRNTEQG